MSEVKMIREELKLVGLSNRKVSVKEVNTGYSTAIYINIKDTSINKKLIQNIIDRYESIDRDDISGEILCGGNTFIFVSYDYNLTLT